ncbi:MAG: hypothetical protein AAF571_10445 [Verrucomicrobiota bacterium]
MIKPIQQFDLFPRRSRRDSAQIEQDMKEFSELLDLHRDWITAAKLGKLTGHDDRYLRTLANRAMGDIISSQQGYKHIRHASWKDLQDGVRPWEKQIEKMQVRCRLTRKAFFKFHPKTAENTPHAIF